MPAITSAATSALSSAAADPAAWSHLVLQSGCSVKAGERG